MLIDMIVNMKHKLKFLFFMMEKSLKRVDGSRRNQICLWNISMLLIEYNLEFLLPTHTPNCYCQMCREKLQLGG